MSSDSFFSDEHFGFAAEQTLPPESLGNPDFRRRYGVRYAYVAGGMYKGIASVDLVITMAKAGLMSFYGAGGLSLDVIEQSLAAIKAALPRGQSFGVNLLPDYQNPELEMQRVELLLQQGVRFIEAAAFMAPTPALLRYCLTGIHKDPQGRIVVPNTVMAKVSHPKVAEMFLQPAPQKILLQLLEQGYLSEEEVALAKHVPLAKDICVEADSGGHTDAGNPSVLFPAIKRLADAAPKRYGYQRKVTVGLAGGIGSPDSALAAFMLGADFILTGSINQCTPQAGTSDVAKDLLQAMDVQDTSYAPAGDMFETGARVQVLKRGALFAPRANKLYQIYLQYPSLDALPEAELAKVEKILFNTPVSVVWAEVAAYIGKKRPQQLQRLQSNPKQKMAAIFRWYFVQTTRFALAGDTQNQTDFQIHTGPALGDFNQWLKGSQYESWQQRHVDVIAQLLMSACAQLMSQRLDTLLQYQMPEPAPLRAAIA